MEAQELLVCAVGEDLDTLSLSSDPKRLYFMKFSHNFSSIIRKSRWDSQVVFCKSLFGIDSRVHDLAFHHVFLSICCLICFQKSLPNLGLPVCSDVRSTNLQIAPETNFSYPRFYPFLWVVISIHLAEELILKLS